MTFDPGYETCCEDCKSRITEVDECGTSHGCDEAECEERDGGDDLRAKDEAATDAPTMEQLLAPLPPHYGNVEAVRLHGIARTLQDALREVEPVEGSKRMSDAVDAALERLLHPICRFADDVNCSHRDRLDHYIGEGASMSRCSHQFSKTECTDYEARLPKSPVSVDVSLLVSLQAERAEVNRRIERSRVDDCWIWPNATNAQGYGHMRVGESTQLAHRFFWEKMNGKIPEDMCLHHTCETPACVNPSHLKLIDPGQHSSLHNSADKQGAAKLDWPSVRAIRETYSDGVVPLAALAAEYGVSESNIHRIVNGQTWKNDPALDALADRPAAHVPVAGNGSDTTGGDDE